MAGLRIHHPSLTATTLLVPHPGDPHTGRKPKDYHIRLDGNGDAIVSETVWMRLQQAEAAGFAHGLVFVNVVEQPPSQRFGDVAPDPTYARRHRVTKEALRQLAPAGVMPRVVSHPIPLRRERNGQ